MGWVIPHSSDADDAEGLKKLTKAEGYEKHALELIPAMPKPPNVSEEQFAAAKKTKLSQAHSGLGLVYFREENWAESVKELREATQGADSPDPTDLYALAVGLEQLSLYAEAAAAYDKCSASPGALQVRCKQSADKARSQANAAK